MNIATMSRSLLVAMASAAVVFSWTTDARSDGEFLEPFPPAYPEGDDYDLFTATLDDLGLLADSDDEGDALNDERCDSNGEATQQLVIATINAIATLEFGCAALPPAAEDICFGVLAVNEIARTAAEINIAQCALQDALVDGAEIEAAFENTVKLINLSSKVYEKQIEDNLLDCRPVVGLFLPESSGGLSEWVSELVDQRIDQFDEAIGDPQRVQEADLRLAEGDVEFDAGNFEKAYCLYCASYSALADSDDDSDSDDDDCDSDDD